jgi:hypothetical protein
MQSDTLNRHAKEVVGVLCGCWLALTVYGLACFFKPQPTDAGPDPLPDLDRIVWLAWGFWIGGFISFGSVFVYHEIGRTWRVISALPATSQIAIFLIIWLA